MKKTSRPKAVRPPKSNRQRRTFVPYQSVRNIRANTLEDLPAKQAAALKNWLFKDKLTYRQIQARLLAEFGVKICINRICRYWKSHRQPVREQSPMMNNLDVVFDVVIQSTQPVRIQIFRSQLRLRTKIQKVFPPRP